MEDFKFTDASLGSNLCSYFFSQKKSPEILDKFFIEPLLSLSISHFLGLCNFVIPYYKALPFILLILKVIATGLSLSLVDRIGRKKCLTIGILVMGLAILTLGIFAVTNGSEASKQTCHEFTNGTLTVDGSTTHKPLETEK